MSKPRLRLGVNIDHVATLRQVRGTRYPDPVQAARIVEQAGANGITLHLREDRRHIQDEDLFRLMDAVSIPVNLEIAVTEEMTAIALAMKPEHVCLVPEKRGELTTEGGLDVIMHQALVTLTCEQLAKAGIKVSLFIDPDVEQIAVAKMTGALAVELHTGAYADANEVERTQQLERLKIAARYAKELGLIVNAGHGLTLNNVGPICQIPQLNELNIGHALVADAVFIGLADAVKGYLKAMS